jgi:hypothetical protein
LSQRVIDAEATKEMAHNLAGSIGKGLFHFIEMLAVLFDICNDVSDRITQFTDLVDRQDINRANKPITFKALSQRVHINESSHFSARNTNSAHTTNAKRA